ncbi:MAG: PorP/SprF family type IX secretion system membrane protein [Saprospiraceae bacterium]|nr:PorP/SprF family type IX secretion system membrane protein [Saprospiraceae bacterium]MBP6567224.1 PorP/SprF family type IX secretion system membrane protein [Saprospiraceae bacterium]
MKYTSVFILIFITNTCFCQQAISSQYTLIPTELNAGLTGSACGLRAITHYQSIRYKYLASTTFINYGASLDMPVKLKNGDRIGLGYNYIGDLAGESSYSNTGHSINVAYLKRLSFVEGKPTFVSLGLSAGLIKNTINVGGLRWPSQIGPNGFDPAMNPNENITGNIRYPNVNLGLVFTGPITSSISTNSGLSINHVNTPNVSFLGGNTPLKSRIIAYTKLDIMLNTTWSIHPTLYYTKQGSNNFYMIGTDLAYHFNQDNAISFGGGYGKNDQPFINAGVNINRLNIGLNYGFAARNSYHKLECIIAYLITKNKCN